MKKTINTLGKVFSGITTSFVLLTSRAYAVSTDPLTVIGGITEGTGSDSLLAWIKSVLNLVIGLAGLASVVVLIASGYMFITANGDEDKIQKATKSLTFAIIGLVICLISVLIVQFVLKEVVAR
jgi:hypothetical protein